MNYRELSKKDAGEIKASKIYISDIFYIMHALFPKDSNYQDSPFLKVDEKSCLQFNDMDKSINTPYPVYWRGADASISTKDYVLESGSANVLNVPFPYEEKHLTWANGQLAEFFWQVYNNDDAITWGVYDTIMGKDGVEDSERVREEEITVYEKKMFGGLISRGISLRHVNLLHKENYKGYVGDFLKNSKDNSGNLLFKGNEVEALRKEWEEIAREIALKTIRETHAKFRNDAKNLTWKQLEDRKSEFNPDQIKFWLLPDKIKEEGEVSDEMINLWDKWKVITADKRVGLESIHAELGKKRGELTKIGFQKADKEQKLNDILGKIKALETGRIDHLRDQLKFLGDKLTNPSDANIISHQETIAIRTLIYFLTDLEKEGKLESPLTDTEKEYLTKVEQLETTQNASLPAYSTWKELGNSFQERLDNWEKNEGRNLTGKSITIYFNLLKHELNNAKQTIGLSPEEETELLAINNYLTEPELRSENLRSVFKIDADISISLVQEYKNYGDQKHFKKDELKLKEIANILLNLEDKNTFFNELKEYLKDKKGLPAFPADSADNYQKQDYFFTLNPEYVIKFSATYQIKNDSSVKEQTKQAMEKVKNDQNQGLDKKLYGDGQEFTEAGIIKYYVEELGGVNHSFVKQGTKSTPPSQEGGFWRMNNPSAWATGFALLLLLSSLGWAIWKRKLLVQWWNSPAELEEEDDD